MRRRWLSEVLVLPTCVREWDGSVANFAGTELALLLRDDTIRARGNSRSGVDARSLAFAQRSLDRMTRRDLRHHAQSGTAMLIDVAGPDRIIAAISLRASARVPGRMPVVERW